MIATRLGVIAGVLAALALVPTAMIERLPSVCLFDRVFDVACLGCGMTRALSAALHGEWALAFELNRLVGYALLFALGSFSIDAWRLAKRWRVSNRMLRRGA